MCVTNKSKKKLYTSVFYCAIRKINILYQLTVVQYQLIFHSLMKVPLWSILQRPIMYCIIMVSTQFYRPVFCVVLGTLKRMCFFMPDNS